HEGGYYVRLSVLDRPGAMAKIATRVAEQQISLESIVQKGRAIDGEKAETVPVILITHATTESAIRQALDHVQRDGTVTEAPQVIRIER
ncbi:MAG: ACT domain-containing protein, partial [Beijerinckiaceae bacterium]